MPVVQRRNGFEAITSRGKSLGIFPSRAIAQGKLDEVEGKKKQKRKKKKKSR
jgi:hypothetical protein